MNLTEIRLRRLIMAEMFWKTGISAQEIAQVFGVTTSTVYLATRQYLEDTDFDNVRTTLTPIGAESNFEQELSPRCMVQKPTPRDTKWRREHDNLLKMLSWNATLQEMANAYNVSYEAIRQGLRYAGLTKTCQQKKRHRKKGVLRLTTYHPNKLQHCNMCHIGFVPEELTSGRCRSCNNRHTKEWRKAHPERAKAIQRRTLGRAAVVQLVCDNPSCGQTFVRNQYMVKNRKKIGQQRFYCSPSCALTHSHQLWLLGRYSKKPAIPPS